ncbi:protoporphyrinogen oxidase [bacterium 210820-DFI.6.37]|nr:protoporphyrinogen oxidase [bacterium 210820-DFI.6.37]
MSESGQISKTGNLYKTEVIAALFDLTPRRVQQLTKDGVLKTTSAKEGGRRVNRYELVPTIQRYIKFLSEKSKGKNVKNTDSENESAKIEAEARYKQAKAEMVEMDLKELRGELHRAEDVEAIMTNHVYAVRSMLMTLPSRLAVDTANAKTKAEAAELIRKAVNDIMTRLSELAYDETDYKKLARERRGWEQETDEEAR